MRAHGKNQPNGPNKLLSVGDVARRLRVSVDVVRSLTESGQLKAVRTGGRHRRYKPEDVERYQSSRRGTGHDRHVGPTAKKIRPVDQVVREPQVEEYGPTLEELQAEEARWAARERAQAEEERLEGWKKYGRELAKYTSLPAEWHVKIIESLEDFVTTKRIPPTLSREDAQLIVRAHVNSFVTQHGEDVRERQQKERDAAAERRRADEERQRIDDERRQKEREAEEQRRKEQENERRLKGLIDRGNNHAWSETISWDSSEAEGARRDVARALKEKVKADWTEADVEDLVDDVLYEDDEGEESDEEESEEEEGDENW